MVVYVGLPPPPGARPDLDAQGRDPAAGRRPRGGVRLGARRASATTATTPQVIATAAKLAARKRRGIHVLVTITVPYSLPIDAADAGAEARRAGDDRAGEGAGRRARVGHMEKVRAGPGRAADRRGGAGHARGRDRDAAAAARRRRVRCSARRSRPCSPSGRAASIIESVAGATRRRAAARGRDGPSGGAVTALDARPVASLMVADRRRARRAHARRAAAAPLALGVVLGVLFVAAGAGRLCVERRLTRERAPPPHGLDAARGAAPRLGSPALFGHRPGLHRRVDLLRARRRRRARARAARWLVFLVAGSSSRCSCSSYVEGASLHQERGGATVLARYGFNELWSFVAGWAILLDYLILIALTRVRGDGLRRGLLGRRSRTGAPEFLLAVARDRRTSRSSTCAGAGRGAATARRCVVLADLALQLLIVALGLALLFEPERAHRPGTLRRDAARRATCCSRSRSRSSPSPAWTPPPASPARSRSSRARPQAPDRGAACPRRSCPTSGIALVASSALPAEAGPGR